jgi:hypothetical protein
MMINARGRSATLLLIVCCMAYSILLAVLHLFGSIFIGQSHILFSLWILIRILIQILWAFSLLSWEYCFYGQISVRQLWYVPTVFSRDVFACNILFYLLSSTRHVELSLVRLINVSKCLCLDDSFCTELKQACFWNPLKVTIIFFVFQPFSKQQKVVWDTLAIFWWGTR